jgi:hypothetical protein
MVLMDAIRWNPTVNREDIHRHFFALAEHYNITPAPESNLPPPPPPAVRNLTLEFPIDADSGTRGNTHITANLQIGIQRYICEVSYNIITSSAD